MSKQKDLDYMVRNIEQINSSDSEKALSDAIDKLVKEFSIAKNFNKRQIKAMSLLQTNRVCREIIVYWINNMKHLKGNYRKSCEKLLKEGFRSLGNIIKTEKEGFLSNLFHRNR